MTKEDWIKRHLEQFPQTTAEEAAADLLMDIIRLARANKNYDLELSELKAYLPEAPGVAAILKEMAKDVQKKEVRLHTPKRRRVRRPNRESDWD